MLKSLCIKTNNNRAINYLLDEFSNAKLNNLYISTSKFKLYNNFIIHYKGKELDTFYTIIADILSSLIINLYEENLIKRIISSNNFYFADIEQRKIRARNFCTISAQSRNAARRAQFRYEKQRRQNDK